MTEPVHDALARRGLTPGEHAADTGYASADLLLAARARGITLLAPVPPDSSPQARSGGYTAAMFTIDWENKQVTCPQSAVSSSWTPTRYRRRPRRGRRGRRSCRERQRAAARPRERQGDDRAGLTAGIDPGCAPRRGRCGTPRRWDTRRRGHGGPLPARGHHGSPAPPHSHRGARRLRHPAGPSGHALASRRTAPAAGAIQRTAIVRGRGRSRPEPPRRSRRASDHHLPGVGWAVTTCEQAPSRPQAPGAYWGHGPDHRDNPRRDPRHMACRHGCGRDRCNAQDVSPHRADRDGRLHRRVARGQAPSPQLARRSRRGQRDRNTVLRTSSGPDRTDRSTTERRTTCARFEVRGVPAPLGGVRQSAHAGTT